MFFFSTISSGEKKKSAQQWHIQPEMADEEKVKQYISMYTSFWLLEDLTESHRWQFT